MVQSRSRIGVSITAGLTHHLPIHYHSAAMSSIEVDRVFTQRPMLFVRYAEELGVYRQFDAEGRYSGRKFRMEVELDDDGSPHCRALEVRAGDDGDVSSTILRGVPVAQLLSEVVTAAAFKIAPPPTEDSAPKLAPDSYRETQLHQTPLTDENLQQVATLYRAAVEQGDHPTETVANAMHVSRSTAARWVTRARKRGFLGPAMRGRGGEAS